MRALWDRLSPQHMVGSQSQPIVSLAQIQLTKAALNASTSTTMAGGQNLRTRNGTMMTNLVELFGVADFSDPVRRDIVVTERDALLAAANSMGVRPRELVFTSMITPATPANVRWAQGLAASGFAAFGARGAFDAEISTPPDGPPTFTGLNDEQNHALPPSLEQ